MLIYFVGIAEVISIIVLIISLLTDRKKTKVIDYIDIGTFITSTAIGLICIYKLVSDSEKLECIIGAILVFCLLLYLLTQYSFRFVRQNSKFILVYFLQIIACILTIIYFTSIFT